MTGSDVHDMTYYKKCMMGGILSCGITHTIVCPLDIVKCRMQASPGLYKGVGDGFKTIKAAEGMKGFTLVSTVFYAILTLFSTAIGMGPNPPRILRSRFRKVRFL